MRELGKIENIDLGIYAEAYKNIKAGLKHLGVHKAREWAMLIQGMRQKNRERVYLERKRLEEAGLKDAFPEAWAVDEESGEPTYLIPESEAEAEALVRKILGEGLASCGDQLDAKAVEEAFRLGVAHQLVPALLAIQNPTQAEVFSSGS